MSELTEDEILKACCAVGEIIGKVSLLDLGALRYLANHPHPEFRYRNEAARVLALREAVLGKDAGGPG